MAGPDERARVVLATRNPGKFDEVRRILEPLGLRLLGLDAFPDAAQIEESGASFLENALLKARAAARDTGLPALADDSGLAVDALGGAPGVRSARYGGEPRSDARNNECLLAALSDVADARRGAAFVCVAAVALPTGDAIWEEGRWQGRVLRAPRGKAGFGYDPLFFDPAAKCTAAEMAPAGKDARSHRGRAFGKLAARLPAFLRGRASKQGSGPPVGR